VTSKVIKLQIKILKMKKSLLLVLGLVSVMFLASCRNQEAATTEAVEETTEAVEETTEAVEEAMDTTGAAEAVDTTATN
jgi:PBP1b-binding outer membrane lipoprotein LpoB